MPIETYYFLYHMYMWAPLVFFAWFVCVCILCARVFECFIDWRYNETVRLGYNYLSKYYKVIQQNGWVLFLSSIPPELNRKILYEGDVDEIRKIC